MKGRGFWKHGGARGSGPLYKHHTGINRPAVEKQVDCPESACQVCFSTCVRCEKFQHWHEKDDGLRRCEHEFLNLDSRGYYDGTWDDHPENFDPETFERIQEEKQRNEDFYREMELEREELKRMAEELEKREQEMGRNDDSDYDEYLKDEYGEYEEEDDEKEEEDEYEEENEEDEEE